MRIVTINGSQKPGESNTGIILNKLTGLIKKEHELIEYALGSKTFSPGIYKEISTAGVIVLAFPLYIDSVPSNVLAMLIELEEYIKKGAVKDMALYAIINNGFYEGRQTRIAFEIIQHWCVHAGLSFGGGIGQGAGEMIKAVRNMPMDKGPFSNLGRELALLAGAIASKEPFGIKYLSPRFPRFLWRFMATHTFWHPLARQNKVRKHDITKRIP
jgi:multimeric flavodoxin WrbA